jgi:hypothetical protein
MELNEIKSQLERNLSVRLGIRERAELSRREKVIAQRQIKAEMQQRARSPWFNNSVWAGLYS